jgi:hypothetical protein
MTFVSIVTPDKRARRQFLAAAGPSSNCFNLSCDDRGAHIALQLSLSLRLIIKIAGMVRLEPVLGTKVFLTLTRDTCECELYTTLWLLAALWLWL